jgi:hypothetical protein
VWVCASVVSRLRYWVQAVRLVVDSRFWFVKFVIICEIIVDLLAGLLDLDLHE